MMKKLLILFMCALTADTFCQSSDASLTTQADVIRNETMPSGNTRERVADMFQGLIDSKLSRSNDLDLVAIEALSSFGIATRTASNTWVIRSLSAGDGISITNSDGVSGNPTIGTSLTATHIGFGNGSNSITGDSKFTWDNTSENLIQTGGTSTLTPGTKNNSLIFVDGTTISSNFQWSVALGETHNITTTFNDGLVVGESMTVSGGVAGNNGMIGRNHGLLGAGSKVFNFQAGENNDIDVSTTARGNFLSGENNLLSGTTINHSAIIGGIAITGTASNSVYMPKLFLGLGTSGALTSDATQAELLSRNSSTGEVVTRGILQATATLDFSSTDAANVSDLTISVTGAVVGDVVQLGVPNGSVTTTATFTAWVSASDTVTVRFSPKATEDPDSGTFKVIIIK